MIGDMVFFDKVEDVAGGEPREGGFTEVAVARDIVCRGNVQVREIASATAGYADLRTGPDRMVQDKHAAAAFSAFDGAQQA
jgi:hypothetical protein